MRNYETITEALHDLAERGYTLDFSLYAQKDCLVCKKTTRQLSPDEFEIEEIYRFEGASDPGDETIIFVISSTKFDVKGVVVNAFGVYADDIKTRIVEKLKIFLDK